MARERPTCWAARIRCRISECGSARTCMGARSTISSAANGRATRKTCFGGEARWGCTSRRSSADELSPMSATRTRTREIMRHMALNVVVLAAGQGKRMNSDRPKVLHTLGGRPLLAHVIDCARALDAARICVVYGHGGEQVPQALAGSDLAFVLQEPQLGTGHALALALPCLSNAATTLVLYGDVPLVRPATMRALVAVAGNGVAVLTAELKDPTGYGRIIRSADGALSDIVEERDATQEQRAIREVNTGLMALPTSRLAGWMKRLTNDNAQQEYYLPDVVKLALQDG